MNQPAQPFEHLRDRICDRKGHPVNVGEPVILTGRIHAFHSEGLVEIHFDGEEGENTYGTSVYSRHFLKGQLNDFVPGPVIVRAMQAAKNEIERLQRQLADVQGRAQAREDVLQATIVRLHAEAGSGRMPYGLNGAQVSSEMPVVMHLESLITALQTPPAPAERKPSAQECADMEFQAGRNIARARQTLGEDASEAAREGYDFEFSKMVRASEPEPAPPGWRVDTVVGEGVQE
jgi:hypothetical protein